MRDVFVVGRFWNMVRKRFLRAVGHRDFEFSFDFSEEVQGFL